ncbi:zinc finger CONSTANS-like [Olea europaea subsp. europaea]|uniref:Zinc finger CONSTANS-like n=1 Tax=Olea europaea subsp. europaea TaxID=158383 RepID=A0A8S0QE82_OLEEU|nr:zinc finger CONSTANS-like [Olea europaea subsp. europaea]
MSSELFEFDNSFFFDLVSPLTDIPIYPHSHEILQENPNVLIQENTLLFDETNTLNQISRTLLSSSPTSTVNLENQSLSHFGNEECSVKKEKYRNPLVDNFGNSVMAESYDEKFLQRSYSSNSHDGKPNLLFYPPGFDGSLVESQSLHENVLNSLESDFSYGQIRRDCSTGYLQKMKTNTQTRNALSSSPLSTERSFVEDPNFKVRRYSAEERRERIHRYRAKRTQRNFNKTIKYACRKTLADNRLRVHGRFARNDEGGEIPKASMFNRHEDDDGLWLDRILEEDDEGIIGGGSYFDRFGSSKYQNYSYQC